MYECSICYEVNHAYRHHCSHCGAVPASYSILGKPSRLISHEGLSQFIEVVAAIGCSRAVQHHGQRIYLRTVTADYYAEGV